MQNEYFIGLMSGTSLDGIDACILNTSHEPVILATHYQSFSAHLKAKLLRLIEEQQASLLELCQIEVTLSTEYAEAVSALLAKANLVTEDIAAIGCHGQTVFHLPDDKNAFSMQLGSGAHLAEQTGLPVVTDFRNNDMALGGQGAPLVCAFHQALCQSQSAQLFLNLGGIANLTWIPESGPVSGYDTGPANALLDMWYQQHHSETTIDNNGDWAATGAVSERLLSLMLKDPYFARPAPKSTGKEYFNLEWLNERLSGIHEQLAPEDIQATLIELTACTIAEHINHLLPKTIYVFGGGVKNARLMTSLQDKVAIELRSTSELGIEGDYMEAAAFAWLAKQRINNNTGSLSSVTGSSRNALCGALYCPSP